MYGVLLVTAHRLGVQKSDLVEFHDGGKPLGDDLLAAAAILLLMPGLIAVVGSWWAGSKSIRRGVLRIAGSSETHNAASAWNQVFSRQGPCLVRVTLTDGRIVGGFFDESSLAGYSEHFPDLFLSQRWDLDDDGWFVGPADRSLGIWLPSGGISSLDLYEVEDSGILEREIPKIRS